MRVRKMPPVTTWTEDIDDAMGVGCASTRKIKIAKFYDEKARAIVSQRRLYALACFVLVARTPGWSREAADRAYLELLAMFEKRHGRLNYIGPADGIED